MGTIHRLSSNLHAFLGVVSLLCSVSTILLLKKGDEEIGRTRLEGIVNLDMPSQMLAFESLGHSDK